MGGTSRITTFHDKDVRSDRVKRDIPQDMGLHLVARRASIDKDRPEHRLLFRCVIRVSSDTSESFTAMRMRSSIKTPSPKLENSIDTQWSKTPIKKDTHVKTQILKILLEEVKSQKVELLDYWTGLLRKIERLSSYCIVLVSLSGAARLTCYKFKQTNVPLSPCRLQ
jgi:hypothetical protein